MDSGILSDISVRSSSLLNCSLKCRTNCCVVPLNWLSNIVLVRQWVIFLFSEAPLDEVVMYSEYSFHTACASVVLRYFLTLVLPIPVNKVSLKTLYMKTCLASNNSCSSGEEPGVKVGSSISETSWDFEVMKRSLWNLSKYLSSFRVE